MCSPHFDLIKVLAFNIILMLSVGPFAMPVWTLTKRKKRKGGENKNECKAVILQQFAVLWGWERDAGEILLTWNALPHKQSPPNATQNLLSTFLCLKLKI